jgi:hypothetical protein
VDPALPGQGLTTVFVACDPDPAGLAESSCARYQQLEDPTQLIALGADGGFGSIPGARLLGFNSEAAYTAPVNLFDSLAPGDLNRQRGVLADVLALTVAEVVPIPPSAQDLQGLAARVKSKQTPSALSLKEIRITETDALNVNPALTVIFTPDRELGPNLGLNLLPGHGVALGAATPVGADETYVSIGPDGSMETRTEAPIYSWFATAGTLTLDRTTTGSPSQFFTAPIGGPIPADRTIQNWVVVRDERGGVDWVTYPGFVCDTARPQPSVSGSTFSDPNHPDRVTLAGGQLAEILDVGVEGLPVAGRFDPTTGSWTGDLPIGPAGMVTLTLTDTGCRAHPVAVVHP